MDNTNKKNFNNKKMGGEKMEREIIERGGLKEKNGHIYCDFPKNLKPEEIANIKENKEKYISLLVEIRNEKEKTRKEKENKKYEPLEAELPERKIESENNDEKAQEILSKMDKRHFRGEEDDGLNHAIAAHNFKLQAEAQKYCRHELRADIWRTYTSDARLKVERTISCKKCGLYIQDTVSEPVSENAMWN